LVLLFFKNGLIRNVTTNRPQNEKEKTLGSHLCEILRSLHKPK